MPHDPPTMTRALLLAIIWTLVILAACSIPGKDLPAIDIFSIDKIAHFVVFAGFGWVWMWALKSPPPRRTAYVLAFGLAYAALTEVYQGFLPFDRTPDPKDALANALGLLTAILIYRLTNRNRLSKT